MLGGCLFHLQGGTHRCCERAPWIVLGMACHTYVAWPPDTRLTHMNRRYLRTEGDGVEPTGREGRSG